MPSGVKASPVTFLLNGKIRQKMQNVGDQILSRILSGDNRISILDEMYPHILSPRLSGFTVISESENKCLISPLSTNTLFRYEIRGITEAQAKEITAINSSNSSSKYVDRALKILALGGKFHFHSVPSFQFSQTLQKIDTLLPEFVAEMLVGFYTKNGNSLSDLVEYLSASKTILDKFDFKLSREDYEFKLKQLLSASALGMQPSKPWDGMMRANGGYLIVVRSGDVLCYHAFNRDVFLSYLFNNTRFESPASRDAPILEMDIIDGKVYTDLKLQIRFI